MNVLIPAEQIARRVRELAHDISEDYRGKTLYAVCVLENGFMFMADLVRALEVPVVCQFVKPESRVLDRDGGQTTEIRYSPEVKVQGQHVLLVEGVVKSGVTQEFLMRNLTARGALSVKLATLLDKQAGRRIGLRSDYFGYAIEEQYVIGYGLGSPLLGRNLPYIATAGKIPASAAG